MNRSRAAWEAEVLWPLFLEAWELRGSPYLYDAAGALVAAHERRALTLLEREQEKNARAIRLLRDTSEAARSLAREAA